MNYKTNITKDNIVLNPYWITGFSDAESSFSIRIFKDEKRKYGWRITPIFSIELHKRDLLLLKRIQAFFGVGSIYKHRSNMVYSVQSNNNLSLKIIPHFDKYPLLTKKEDDFLIFKKVVDLLNKKMHLSSKGLQDIVNLRASLNKGLSEILTNSFPKTIPFIKPIICSDKKINPNWLVGFVDGEGCFYVKPTKLGFNINISISQHIRDELLLKNISNYLDCGLIEKPITRSSATFVVYKSEDIYNKIIPFFKNYPLQGIKFLDFQDFEKVACILNNKSKLTNKDLELIKNIKLNMNKNRYLI